MLKSRFRQRLDFIHIRIGLIFSKVGISPNAWTLMSLIPAAVGLLLLWQKMLFWGLVFFAASAFIDIIDGNVARVTKSVSALGAFMDGVIDRYVEFALYLGLAMYLDGVEPVIAPNILWMVLLIFGALMPSFITAYADHRKVVTDEEKLKKIGGYVERFERLSLLYIGMYLGVYNIVHLQYMIILVGVLTNLTALNRIYEVFRNS
jgi:archaetidylinositol phosphate synthase